MTKKSFTFIDLFAGAGGFSEGFLQAETRDKQYDFLLGSDINENCEVTHIIRYKHQLGLKDNKFLKKDITDKDFIHKLKKMIGNKDVDVICGGPPCQSFSLAGRRRTFDKKDDLFKNYLNVVRELTPKYFVMENVKGILTKYDGQVIDRIKREIKEILDPKAVSELGKTIKAFKKSTKKLSLQDSKQMDIIFSLIELLSKNEAEKSKAIQKYFGMLYAEFTRSLPKFSSYHKSKTDPQIATIRHGLKMLENASEWNDISFSIMRAKGNSDIDNDFFVDRVDSFLKMIEPENILEEVSKAIESIDHKGKLETLKQMIYQYTVEVEDYYNAIRRFASCDEDNKYYSKIITRLDEGLSLYRVEDPFVLLASDYGVPQNRERVIFLGCRKDQKFINDIPKTTPNPEDKVNVLEALYDLDNIGINENIKEYKAPLTAAESYKRRNKKLLKMRNPDGGLFEKKGKTFAEWCREGRLSKRFKIKKPSFVKNYNDYTHQDELDHLEYEEAELHNHQTSKHSEEVQKRFRIIREHGDYKKAKAELEREGVTSKKRNYTPFLKDLPSTTIMTIADDYIHYRADRAPTVREMARLQSFDDSFVFQGKRTTGGDRRKDEVPQFTLVGNAVPPLVARAVAEEILKNIVEN